MFDWNHVRSFLAVLDAGSLLAASRVLRTTQPTVGRHITELEAQIGLVLFERTGRALTPTVAGLQVGEAARAMYEGALALEHSLAGAQKVLAGSVRLTASVPVAVHLLPPILARMREALPEVQVELVSNNAVSNLLRREADIAIRMVRPDQANLVARKIADIAMAAYAHRDYLARRGHPARAADLQGHQFVVGDLDDAVPQGLRANGLELPASAFVLRSDDYLVQWQAVRSGLGIGFVTEYLARQDPQVQPVLLGQLPVPTLPMWLAVHQEMRGNPRVRRVFDFLAEHLAQAVQAN